MPGFTLTDRDKSFLKDVHPDLARAIAHAATRAPFRFRIIEGRRTLARQKQLLALKATKTLNSRHLTGHAVDLVPWVDLDGDGAVEGPEIYHWPLYHALAPSIKAAAEEARVPIEWGGDWKTFKDGPHWQLPWEHYPK